MLKTDVKSYYASIDHVLLHEQLSKHIPDKGVLRLLWHHMRRCAERGGMFYDIECGISLGCPLNPLMGALFLQLLDERMEQLGLFYVRYWRYHRARDDALETQESGTGREPDAGRITVGETSRENVYRQDRAGV